MNSIKHLANFLILFPFMLALPFISRAQARDKKTTIDLLCHKWKSNFAKSPKKMDCFPVECIKYSGKFKSRPAVWRPARRGLLAERPRRGKGVNPQPARGGLGRNRTGIDGFAVRSPIQKRLFYGRFKCRFCHKTCRRATSHPSRTDFSSATKTSLCL